MTISVILVLMAVPEFAEGQCGFGNALLREGEGGAHLACCFLEEREAIASLLVFVLQGK